jgi:hypothetical protein
MGAGPARMSQRTPRRAAPIRRPKSLGGGALVGRRAVLQPRLQARPSLGLGRVAAAIGGCSGSRRRGAALCAPPPCAALSC